MSESTYAGHEKATISGDQAANFLVEQWSLSGFDISESASVLVKALLPYCRVKHLAAALAGADADSVVSGVSTLPADAPASSPAPLHDGSRSASSLLLSPRPETTAAPVAVQPSPVKRTVCKFCGRVHLDGSRCG